MLAVVLILFAALVLAGYLQLALRLQRIELELAALRGRGPGLAEADGGQASAAAAEPGLKERQSLGGLFEQLVGGRMLIWIGGIALVVAGFFLILHSIEIGLVTPAMRMIAAALFGLALLGAGEIARRGRFLAEDPRIAQALVGAGIAILFATAYGSWYLFALIGPATASALMLGITVAALLLSERHGAATAAMGVVGGFLTPWLVGDPEGGALPILAYLALLDVAIFLLAWRRGWTWLAAGAVALSFLWTGFLIFGPRGDALAAGTFALLLSLAASLLRPGEGRVLLLMQPVIIALVQLAVLVARLDIGLAAWLLFGALAAAGLLLGLWRRAFRHAAPVALVLALLLLAAKANTGLDPLVPWVAATITLLFAGMLIPAAAGDRLLRTVTACGALAAPLLITRAFRPDLLDAAGWGLAAALLSLGGLVLLRLNRRFTGAGRLLDLAGFAAAATAALLLAAAAYDLVPRDFVSGTWLLIAVAMVIAGIRLADKALRLAGLVLLTATIFRAFLIDAAELEGALRILSFVGLGLALIGMGKLYGTVLRAERKRDGGAGGGEPSGGSFG